MVDKLLNTKQASEYLGVNDKSLANSRHTGRGLQVPYAKLGKVIRYRLSDLDDYIENNTFNHTGEAKEAVNVKVK